MNPQVYLPDEAATLRFAGQLARAMPPPGQPLVVLLQGDLGAGKTCLVRGLLRALGETGPVRSPTYGLVSEYSPAGDPIIHVDLYRLTDPAELETLGLRDMLAGSRLWLVEWPERAQGRLPQPDLTLVLSVEGEGRQVTLEPRGAAGQQWVARVLAGPPS